MSLFEIPHGIGQDLQHVLKTLHGCCEKVQQWGVWHDIPFDASNFTADGGGSWTVTAANVRTLRYQVTNRTMTVAIEVIQSSASGAITALRVKLPLPYRCVNRPVGTPGFPDDGLLYTNACVIRQDLSRHVPGYLSLANIASGELVLFAQVMPFENLNQVGEAGIIGQVTFEVQPT